MKLRILLFLALALVARADILTINSAPFNDGHYGVGFYHSTLNGAPLETVCIDFTHHVGFGQPFEVTIVNLHDFEGPLRTNYLEAAWLVLQLGNGLTDINAISNIQSAIWLITTPGTSDPYLLTSGAFAWATLAAQNYQSINDTQFNLLLRNGELGQSAITVIPEPEMVACFILGGVSLIGFNYLGRRQRAKK